ncbi:FAD/NAD(P)-binding protein [uncultured Polaribacter sp.]|uniref:FAD/NAD(P)-binding protein n=1 Tax=uncultured Polaribacter sp. TaxID=174711 RepID=UPI00261D2B40|nr:FAD/NAD(P)-binding protein [uncultured Polaribacter sp.]
MKKLAIVGFGPRGLSALENLFVEISKENLAINIHTTLFEIEKELGTSKVWNTKQPAINWVNISERALKDLEGRPELVFKNVTIPSFPSYLKWSHRDEKNLDETDADQFPPRKKIGNYLSERADSIVNILLEHKMIAVEQVLITDLEYNADTITLIDLKKNSYIFDEVVLTIGHQPTKIDEDIKDFEMQSIDDDRISFPETYPIENIINSKAINSEKNVAIRGLGLAMIDAVRALTIGKGGRFKILNKYTFESEFISGIDVPKKIIPYSLDGLPIVSKPLNPKIDRQFSLSKTQATYFEKTIRDVADGNVAVEDNTFLKEAIAKISVENYFELENKLFDENIDKTALETIVIKWLTDPNYAHKLIQPTNCSTDQIISSFVEMACGKKAVSLDFCVGQVIRHCQPILYKSFSHANIDETIIASVILLDEQMKRYSYGPPLESMQQLLALHKCNRIDFNFANNPNIRNEPHAWNFEKEENSVEVTVIINSVLSAPKLLEVSSLIIQNLLRNDLIKPIHSKLGIHTQKDGLILNAQNNSFLPIAVLGRLAKGSVIGVDAILECFGTRIEDWAVGCVNRLKE